MPSHTCLGFSSLLIPARCQAFHLHLTRLFPAPQVAAPPGPGLWWRREAASAPRAPNGPSRLLLQNPTGGQSAGGSGRPPSAIMRCVKRGPPTAGRCRRPRAGRCRKGGGSREATGPPEGGGSAGTAPGRAAGRRCRRGGSW